jgi:quinol monooxygenase YgiN
MHIISGEFKVKDQYREALIEISLKLIPLSLEEPGCISYSFLEDRARPGHFLFFERWESREGITAHFEKPYFKDFAEKFPNMIEGEATIEIHEVTETETV